MSAPLRVAVAEDEPLNRRRLVRLLEECGCEVAEAFHDGAQLAAWLEAGGRADALFLDVEMPELDGLGLAERLAQGPPVVFVTAHPEHAVAAFTVEAADYLLKPVTTGRLAEALARVRRRLPAASSGARKGGRYAVQAGGGVVFVEFARTTHFEVVDEVVWAHAGEAFRTLWRSLGEVEAQFPEAGLLRVQRHLLLRPEAVVGLRASLNGRLKVRLQGGAELEASRGATPLLKERLGLAGKDVERKDGAR
ncbi:MAG TPA: LytTR family DNA-binding domain-containing protein [Holophagaceae bacterium]|nr:LytTR family DNA-binding domain-containing protein [Holophagaceae bacterium]